MSDETGTGVPRHPIGVVSERTGLSPDVLRVWERRYGVVHPARDPAGQRLYSDAEVDRLRLLRRAAGGGRAIAQVAGLTTAELSALVAEDEGFRAAAAEAEPGAEGLDLERAEAFCRALDPQGLQALLHRSLAVLGLPHFVEAVAAPLLRWLGDSWHAGRLSIAEEHLATATVQRVLLRGLETLVPPAGAPTLVLATPAGERHEVGALLAAAVAASGGWRVVYLGPDVPAGEIAAAALRTGARAVGLSVIYVADPGRTAAELAALRQALPRSVPMIVGGAGAAALGREIGAAGIRVFAALRELGTALDALARTG